MGENSYEVSNLLSSPASGEFLQGILSDLNHARFQFIEFPSEWGVKDGQLVKGPTSRYVSNLLSSPASGEDFFVDDRKSQGLFPIY